MLTIAGGVLVALAVIWLVNLFCVTGLSSTLNRKSTDETLARPLKPSDYVKTRF